MYKAQLAALQIQRKLKKQKQKVVQDDPIFYWDFCDGTLRLVKDIITG